MNIFRFEFKSLFPSIFKWSISVTLLSLVYVAFYSVLESQMVDYLKVMPEQLISILHLEQLVTFDGYFVFILSYISLVLAVQATWLGIDTFNSEFRTQSLEFLYVKPISKLNIIKYKFLARFLVLLSTWFVWVLLVNLYLSLFQHNHTMTVSVLLSVSVLISSCLMMGFGMIVGVLYSNMKNSYMVSFVLALFMFVYDMLVPSLNSNVLSKLSLFSYIDKYALISNGAIDTLDVMMSIFVIVTTILCSVMLFLRKKNYIR